MISSRKFAIFLIIAALATIVASEKLDIDLDQWATMSLDEKKSLEDAMDAQQDSTSHDVYPEDDVDIEDPPAFSNGPWLPDFEEDEDKDRFNVKHTDVELNPDTIIFSDEDHDHLLATKLPEPKEMEPHDVEEDSDPNYRFQVQAGEFQYVKSLHNEDSGIQSIGSLPGEFRIRTQLIKEKGIKVGSILCLKMGIFRVVRIEDRDALGWSEVDCEESGLNRAIKNAEWSAKNTHVRPDEGYDHIEDTMNDMKVDGKHLTEVRNLYMNAMQQNRLMKLDVLRDQLMENFDSSIPTLGEEVTAEQRNKYGKFVRKSRRRFFRGLKTLRELASQDVEWLLKRSSCQSVEDNDSEDSDVLLMDSDLFLRRLWRGVKRFARRAWRGVKRIARAVVRGVVGIVKGVLKTVAKFAKYALKKLVSMVKTLAKTLWTFLKAFTGTVSFNFDKSLINISVDKKNITLFQKKGQTKDKKSGSYDMKVILKHYRFAFKPGAVLRGSIKFFRLQHFAAYVYSNFEFIIKILFQIDAKYSKKWEKTVYEWKKEYKFMIGPIPVVIKIHFGIYAGAIAKLKAKFHSLVGYEYRYNMKVGVGYTNGKWHKICEKKRHKKFIKPKPGACLNIYAEAYLKGILSILLYGSTGPTFTVEPYISFEFLGDGRQYCDGTKLIKDSAPSEYSRLAEGRGGDDEDEDEEADRAPIYPQLASSDDDDIADDDFVQDSDDDWDTPYADSLVRDDADGGKKGGLLKAAHPSFWEIRLGLRMHLGIVLKIFKKTIGNWQKTIFNKSIRLAGGCINVPGMNCDENTSIERLNTRRNADGTMKDKKGWQGGFTEDGKKLLAYSKELNLKNLVNGNIGKVIKGGKEWLQGNRTDLPTFNKEGEKSNTLHFGNLPAHQPQSTDPNAPNYDPNAPAYDPNMPVNPDYNAGANPYVDANGNWVNPNAPAGTSGPSASSKWDVNAGMPGGQSGIPQSGTGTQPGTSSTGKSTTGKSSGKTGKASAGKSSTTVKTGKSTIDQKVVCKGQCFLCMRLCDPAGGKQVGLLADYSESESESEDDGLNIQKQAKKVARQSPSGNKSAQSQSSAMQRQNSILQKQAKKAARQFKSGKQSKKQAKKVVRQSKSSKQSKKQAKKAAKQNSAKKISSVRSYGGKCARCYPICHSCMSMNGYQPSIADLDEDDINEFLYDMDHDDDDDTDYLQQLAPSIADLQVQLLDSIDTKHKRAIKASEKQVKKWISIGEKLIKAAAKVVASGSVNDWIEMGIEDVEMGLDAVNKVIRHIKGMSSKAQNGTLRQAKLMRQTGFQALDRGDRMVANDLRRRGHRACVWKKRCKCPVARRMRDSMKKIERKQLKPGYKALNKTKKPTKRVHDLAKQTLAGLNAEKYRGMAKLNGARKEAMTDLSYSRHVKDKRRYYKAKLTISTHKAMVTTEKNLGIRGIVKQGKYEPRNKCVCRKEKHCLDGSTVPPRGTFTKMGRLINKAGTKQALKKGDVQKAKDDNRNVKKAVDEEIKRDQKEKEHKYSKIAKKIDRDAAENIDIAKTEAKERKKAEKERKKVETEDKLAVELMSRELKKKKAAEIADGYDDVSGTETDMV